jgi:hypothetical protein
MEHLIQRFIQGRMGRLGVIQTQSMPSPARQQLIQRLMERLSLPERFIARYGWGLRQPDGVALRFQINRVEAIAPGESPETLWLSLQAKLPGLSRTSNLEETPSFEPEHTIPQQDQNLALAKSIPSRKVEESPLDSIREAHSTSAILQKSEQISSPRSTASTSDVHDESKTFRVRRVSPQFADTAGMLSPLHIHSGTKEAIASSHSTPSHQNAIPENPSAVISTVKPITESTVGAGFANEFTSLSNRDTSNLPLRNALTDTDISQPIRVHPNQSLASPPMELGHPLKVSLKSTQPLYAAPHPPKIGGLKITQSPPILGDLGGECNASVLLKQPLRVPANPTNNPLLQSLPKQENSETIATTSSLPLAKSFAQSSPAAQVPLPLAMPKRQQDFESRDRPREIEISADWQHTTHPVPGEQPISPVSQSMNPINVQNITEQVSRQIFRQLRLERERRGIHP